MIEDDTVSNKNKLLAVAILGVVMEGGMPVLQDEYVFGVLCPSFCKSQHIDMCSIQLFKIQGQTSGSIRQDVASNRGRQKILPTERCSSRNASAYPVVASTNVHPLIGPLCAQVYKNLSSKGGKNVDSLLVLFVCASYPWHSVSVALWCTHLLCECAFWLAG